MKIAITTSSFGRYDTTPLKQLNAHHIEYALNPYHRVLTEEEVITLCRGTDGIIAGTEPLTEKVLKGLDSLKVISRCGVGLDNVDIPAAEKQGIKVFVTPTGPILAVAELTVGVILNL